MKIIVWGINYAPEKTGIAPYNTGMCEFLVSRGHEVRMLTTFPYYPEWKKRPGDRGKLYRTDQEKGVRIQRCWHYVPARPSALKRMIHEGSFVATSFVRAMFSKRADVVIVVSPPLLLGTAARLLRLLRRSPYLMHVQDMQPDAAIALGMLREGFLSRVLYRLERFAYRGASVVSGITHGMLDMFRAKGVPDERRLLFPNWAPGMVAPEEPAAGTFRRTHNIPDDTFLAVYSGNLGKKQGLGVVLEASRRIAAGSAGDTRPVQFVIAGDGVEKPALEQRVEREGLSNILLLPLQPRAAYGEMLRDADACLVTQQRGSGALFFPSKLLSILPQARPVIATADPGGELGRAIREGDFGWCVEPDDARGLARIVVEAASNQDLLRIRGRNGRTWVEQFQPDPVLAAFEHELVKRFSRD